MPNDDTLPGPYDPLEDDTVFAMWFDLRPVVGYFCPLSDTYLTRRARADEVLADPYDLRLCTTVSIERD